MKKILFIACGALLAASSCTSEVNEEGFIDKANTISFNAYPNKSRAVSGDVTSDNMKDDNFGVVGYSGNNIYLYKETNKAVEQKWMASSSTWEYADMGDLKFWPNNAMDFYAYFPYTDNATFAASNTSGNVMTIPTTCAHDVLFAFAGDQSKQTLVQTRVPLTFNHAFAKMKSLQIEMPAEGMLNKSGCQIEVKGVEFINTSTSGNIKVDNAGVASYEVATPNVTLSEDLSSVVTVNNANTSGALINNGTNAKGYFFATNSTKVNDVVGTRKAMWNGTKDALNSSKLSKKSFVCLKLTCKVWNGADANKYYYVGGDSSYGDIYIPLKGNITGSDPLTAVTTFDAGKRYIYKIVMKDNVGYTDEGDPILTPILFTVNSVVGWDDVEVTITL